MKWKLLLVFISSTVLVPALTLAAETDNSRQSTILLQVEIMERPGLLMTIGVII
jgi:hypothetical protein